MSEPSLDLTIQPQISPPHLAAAKSAPSNTASTPGAASARLLSMPLILAWACGERTK